MVVAAMTFPMFSLIPLAFENEIAKKTANNHT
nr:MAG TPA: hypothetical protein [Caudoviricetes sp.]